MSYAYLASPYSDPNPRVMEDRYVRACDALNWLISRRIWTYSPVVQCHQLAVRFDLPRQIDFWKSYDRAMLVPAHTLFVLEIDGWTVSRGIEYEVKVAREERIPVNILTPTNRSYQIVTSYDKERLPW